MSISILGISAYCHDSAAALLRDGEIVVAAQEERFTRKKYDARFPARAARWCLVDAGLQLAQVDTVVCHDSGVPEARLHADLAAAGRHRWYGRHGLPRCRRCWRLSTLARTPPLPSFPAR